MCEAVERVNPREAVPGGRLNLLLAGPSCVHHSRARGGRPVNEQDRASAWSILRWVDELVVDTLLVENVPEFLDWGPVGVSGRPIKNKKGESFLAWVRALEAATYRVEWRVLNAADYGDPTTRRRLWVIARRGNRKISWPEPTHSEDGMLRLFGPKKKWRAAREIIDWSVPGQSIFERKKPLAQKTMARIVEGLRRFGGESLQPFLLQLTHGGRLRSVEDPLPTVTGGQRGDIALAQPFILQQQSGGAPRAVSDPLPTIAAAGAQALVQPFLVPMFGERDGQRPRTHAIDDPLPTVTASKGGPALVEPFISHYYGTGVASPITAPLPTATARDRFALVMPEVNGHRLDIRFRMLQPNELARAMSFGDDYKFAGTRSDKVRQIGNAWPCGIAQALVGELLKDMKTARADKRVSAA